MCYLSLNITQHWRGSAVDMRWTITIGYWGRRSSHVGQPSWEMVGWGVSMMPIFHWVVSIPSPPSLVALAPVLLLVLPDPVSLIVAPGVVCRRASILIKESMMTSPTLVLTGAEN